MTCAHKCGRGVDRPPSPDNVRCGSCGHTWWNPDVLSECRQCNAFVYECTSCLKAVGGFRKSNSAEYCRSCWIEWQREKHLREHTYAVTLHTQQPPQQMIGENSVATFSLRCCNMSGEDIFSADAAADMSVGEIREALKEKVGVEMRLARDGKFYTAEEFSGTHSEERCQHAWESAYSLKPASSLLLLLPNGVKLDSSHDDRSILSVINDHVNHEMWTGTS